MEFDMSIFASKFEDTIDWAFVGEYGQKIKDDFQTYKGRKNELSTDPDATSALKLLVETKVTNSFYRVLPGPKKNGFEADFNSFLRNHKQNYRTSLAMDVLTDLIVKYSIFGIEKSKAKDWVEKLLGNYPTMKNLTEDLYEMRKKGRNGLLRDKGADHYLRDVGYWDVIPIDVHEKRFLVRTGIYHALSIKSRQDPIGERTLQDVLSRFCSLYLKGKTIEDIDLGCAPGIVDLFIWSYCSEKRYDICGSTPRCSQCELINTCLFGITNIQRASHQVQSYQQEGTIDVQSSQEPLDIQGPENVKRSLTQQYINDPVLKELLGILIALARDVEKQIKPYQCVFESTKERSGYHYRIPNGKPPVISWAGTRKIGRREDLVKRPCVRVGIKGNLLNSTDSVISNLQWKSDSNWGPEGPGEVHVTIYGLNDKGYKLVLYALVMAAKECLKRSGHLNL